MDIADLPRIVAFKIFRYLPLRDLVRVSRVSSRFYDLSTAILTETKSIDFGDYALRNQTSKSLSNLIDVCAGNLKLIKFPHLVCQHVAEVFAHIFFPKLTTLDLGRSTIRDETFASLVRNMPNLKELAWSNLYTTIAYPDDVVSKNLESLKLFCCDNGSFLSMTGRCPRLKHLEIEVARRVDGEVFDGFFAHCPNLETLILDKVGILRFESMVHFWCLHALRVLILGNDTVRKMTDNDLLKISISFPKLEELELYQLSVTSWGVVRLASLKNLNTLTLSQNTDFSEIDDGIRRLAETGQLIEAKFDADVTALTFLALLRYCRRLRFLYVKNIVDIDTPETAAEVVESLKDPYKKDIVIRLLQGYQLWESEQVPAAFKNLDAIKGHGVQFQRGNMDFQICYSRVIGCDM